MVTGKRLMPVVPGVAEALQRKQDLYEFIGGEFEDIDAGKTFLL